MWILSVPGYRLANSSNLDIIKALICPKSINMNRNVNMTKHISMKHFIIIMMVNSLISGNSK